jgi:DNA-binding CsgD family transcriptional regulator
MAVATPNQWAAERGNQVTRRRSSLSAAERRVLDDAAEGLTARETALRRAKSLETVKSQRRSILLKLGARNMAHAVTLTMRSF